MPKSSQDWVEKERGGVSLYIILGVIFLIVLLSAAAVGFIVFRPDSADGEQGAPTAVPIYYEAGEFVTDLADDGAAGWYIRVSMQFVVFGQDSVSELDSIQSQVTHTIYKIMRNKTVGEVKGDEGMESLSVEIREAVNYLLSKGEVVEVYFTEFIVSR